MTEFGPEAPAKCSRCPRLVAYRKENEAAEPTWFNGAVPSFGPANARLIIVGLAPGRNGANRTGRPFTGDYAGDLLYATLLKFGFARGEYRADVRDGLELDDALRDKIRETIRRNLTPRHVPAKVIQVPDIPRTRNGKLMELAVRNLIHGVAVTNREAAANPEALDLYANIPELKKQPPRRTAARARRPPRRV